MNTIVKIAALAAAMSIASTAAMAACQIGATSIPSGPGVNLTFSNGVPDRNLNAYWLNFQGQGQLYATLAPGQRADFRTGVGQVWYAENNFGLCAFVVRAGELNTEIVVR